MPSSSARRSGAASGTAKRTSACDAVGVKFVSGTPAGTRATPSASATMAPPPRRPRARKVETGAGRTSAGRVRNSWPRASTALVTTTASSRWKRSFGSASASRITDSESLGRATPAGGVTVPTARACGVKRFGPGGVPAARGVSATTGRSSLSPGRATTRSETSRFNSSATSSTAAHSVTGAGVRLATGVAPASAEANWNSTPDAFRQAAATCASVTGASAGAARATIVGASSRRASARRAMATIRPAARRATSASSAARAARKAGRADSPTATNSAVAASRSANSGWPSRATSPPTRAGSWADSWADAGASAASAARTIPIPLTTCPRR